MYKFKSFPDAVIKKRRKVGTFTNVNIKETLFTKNTHNNNRIRLNIESLQ